MDKKKLFIIIGAVVVIVIVAIIIIVIAKNNSRTLKYSKSDTYKMQIDIPEDINKGDYQIIENKDEDIDEVEEEKVEFNNSFADFAIVSDKVKIEFEKKSYTFNQTLEYIEKYGQEEANFENFCKYISDNELNANMYSNIETFDVNGTKAIQYMYKDTLIRVLDTDKINKEMYIAIKIYAKNEQDNILDLVKNDNEIISILNAIKFDKK